VDTDERGRGEDLPKEHGMGPTGRRATMIVFKKQRVYWIDYDVNGHHKRGGPKKPLKKDKTAAWECLLNDERDGPQIH
jgi:hypothetical protein